MERLTKRSLDMVWMKSQEKANLFLEPCEMIAHDVRIILDRLAAYEDTGLTPEEIHELTHSSYGPLHKKLGEWIDAEHDGRLRILPCKFGIKLWRAELDGTVRQYMVTAVNAQDRIHRRTLVECNPFNRFIWEEDFGKQFFLTMKDAEAELERRKHEAHL